MRTLSSFLVTGHCLPKGFAALGSMPSLAVGVGIYSCHRRILCLRGHYTGCRSLLAVARIYK
jgi:hypothetical protein